MEEKEKEKKDVKDAVVVPLRTINQISSAYEGLYAQQQAGTIDSTRANGMLSTLKGVVKLRYEFPLRLAELSVKAQKVKALLPSSFQTVDAQLVEAKLELPSAPSEGAKPSGEAEM
jgi:ATP phosphoribosyltransferase